MVYFVCTSLAGTAVSFKNHFSFLSRKEKRFLHSKEKGDKGKYPLDPSQKRGTYGSKTGRRYSKYA